MSGAGVGNEDQWALSIRDRTSAVVVVSLSSDDDVAATEIGVLAEKIGFAPIKLGGLSEGGLLVQARGNIWGQLIFKDLIKFDG